jgi:hypothetical protein
MMAAWGSVNPVTIQECVDSLLNSHFCAHRRILWYLIRWPQNIGGNAAHANGEMVAGSPDIFQVICILVHLESPERRKDLIRKRNPAQDLENSRAAGL